MKLSHCSCLKEKVVEQKYTDTTYLVYHIYSVILLLLNNM